MSIAIVIGVVAIMGILVYYISRSVGLENEKAALESSKTADETKIGLLEKDRLQNEANLRASEQKAVAVFEAMDDEPELGDARFYPRMREDKDRLN